MILHIFTEELSAKRCFDAIVPKITDAEFRVYPHQGKLDLRDAIKKTVSSISKVPGSKILITIDQDNADCKELKQSIVRDISTVCNCDFRVRIICRELESWFLGDVDAIGEAYVRFNPDRYRNTALLRNVDKISKPSNYLLKILPNYENIKKLPKVEVADRISSHISIDNNTSVSFLNTIRAIKDLTT